MLPDGLLKKKTIIIFKMTDKEILKYGEIQYLKGRLDELFKSFDIMIDVHGSRKLDQRIEKYLTKLKTVDEVSYHLYQVELKTRRKSKDRSKRDIKDLLEQILINENIINEDILERIKKQIDTY
jgi:hypothetical protein